MHILVLILKIIGILLLILLGVLIAFLLSVLFVPVRYRIWGNKARDKTPEITVKIGWLFRIVYFSLYYKEEPEACCRIFGIPVWRNKKDAESDKEQKKSKTKTIETTRELTEEETNETAERIAEKEIGETTEKIAEKEIGEATEKIVEKEIGKTVEKMAEKEIGETTEKIAEKEIGKTAGEIIEKTKKQKDNKKEKISFQKKRKQKKNIVIEKIKHIRERIEEIWKNGKSGKGKIEDKFYNIKEFWNNKEHKEGIRQLIFYGKKIISHCLPKKWNGKVHFGMENPAQTGQVLAVLSVLYGLTGVMLEVEPDFEQAVLEGTFLAKGRIRAGKILWCVFQVWKCKEIIKLKDDFKELRRNL